MTEEPLRIARCFRPCLARADGRAPWAACTASADAGTGRNFNAALGLGPAP